MKKIGFFGGTFDPIHFGHINLALELLEKCQLDEVLFCPAWQSPFKVNDPSKASPEDRAAMVRLAIQEIKAFKLCEIELQRQGVSYTIDTLRALRERINSKKEKLYLLLSEDALEGFHHWKEFETVVELAQPLIGSRGDACSIIPPSPVQNILQKGLVATTRLEISSTQIRKRLKNGLYCAHLAPSQVLDYIEQHNLYTQTP